MFHIHDSQRRSAARQDGCPSLPLELWNLTMLFRPSSHRILEFVVDETCCLMKEARKQPSVMTDDGQKPTAYRLSRTRVMLNRGMSVASTMRLYLVEGCNPAVRSFARGGGKGLARQIQGYVRILTYLFITAFL